MPISPQLLRDIRTKSQEWIKEGQFKHAGSAMEEILAVGGMIAQKHGGTLAKAPLKSRERATEKVTADYGGDWYDIKDIARMTIVVPRFALCDLVMQDLRREFHGSKGRGFVQEKVVRPEADACGYSGMTAFVRTSNGRVGEIQINVPEIIYAKSSEGAVKAILGVDGYMAIRGRMNIEGGLGHAFYEVYRVAPGTPAGKEAAEVSKRYYAYLRRGTADPREADALRILIAALKIKHPAVFGAH